VTKKYKFIQVQAIFIFALGNRQAVNQYATPIDSRIGGTLILTETLRGRSCECY